MSRRQKNIPSIRHTAVISTEMRKEIQQQKEAFEKTSVSISDSASSLRAEVKSPNDSQGSQSSKGGIQILKEEIHYYENDLVSVYDKTEEIHSMVSIEELENCEEFEKGCETKVKIPPPIEPVKFVTNELGNTYRAEYLTDYDICELMNAHKSHAQVIRVEHMKRFDTELGFCDAIIKDIEKIITASLRNDIEVKITKLRDENSSPRCRIQLMRQVPIPKVSKTELGLYGFDYELVENEHLPEIFKPKTELRAVQKEQLAFQPISIIKKLFKFNSKSGG